MGKYTSLMVCSLLSSMILAMEQTPPKSPLLETRARSGSLTLALKKLKENEGLTDEVSEATYVPRRSSGPIQPDLKDPVSPPLNLKHETTPPPIPFKSPRLREKIIKSISMGSPRAESSPRKELSMSSSMQASE